MIGTQTNSVHILICGITCLLQVTNIQTDNIHHPQISSSFGTCKQTNKLTTKTVKQFTSLILHFKLNLFYNDYETSTYNLY